MKRRLAAAVAVMAMVAGWSHAAPLQTDRVAAGAKWVAHIDVEQLKTTHFGQYVLDALGKDEPNRKLLAFQAMFNFDPRKDVASVTLYGRDNRPDNTVLLLKGSFDHERIETIVRGAESYVESRYGEHVVHSWIDRDHGGRRVFGSIAADGTVAMGGEQALKQALDVLDGKAPKATVASFPGLANSSGTPVFVASADLGGMTNVNPQAAVLAQASTAYMALGETADQVQAHIGLGAKSEEAAKQIEDAARGLVAIGILGQQQRPELGRLATGATISRNGTGVEITLKYPAADLVANLQKMAERAAQGGVPRGTPNAPAPAP